MGSCRFLEQRYTAELVDPQVMEQAMLSDEEVRDDDSDTDDDMY